MSIIQGNAHTSAGGGGFQIERSLRFNSADSAYLNRTPASAGNRRTFTWSGWVKRSASGTSQLFAAGVDNNDARFGFASDNLYWVSTSGGATSSQFRTLNLYRDYSAWYHIVLVFDTTQATSTDRIKVYVNNQQATSDSGQFTAPTLNSDNFINSASVAHYIARYWSGSYFSGYLTEVNFVDGQALTPSSFGLNDPETGVWSPKRYTGTYGTNGFYLKFADNSGTTSTTLGKDSSGNGNNWTPNNFSVTAGAGNDSLVDSPTSYGTDTGVGGSVRGNYATWNPLATSPAAPVTFSNGNLDVSFGSSLTGRTQSTIGVSSGKWYAEVTVTAASGTDRIIGIVTPTTNNEPGYTADSYGYYGNGQKINNNTLTNYGASYTTNDIIGIALDLDAGTITFYKNNTSQGQAFSGLSGTYLISASDSSNAGTCSYTANFGQRAFAYTAPSGFKALCTQNLPTPTIGATSTTQANDYFNTILYTGTGSSNARTGVGFQPDFVWIKERNAAADHGLYDAVRGVQKQLESNTTTAETTETTGLTAFGTDGFTVGALAQLNTNGDTYVAWNWKANGAGSTNTAGTITSTVSANTTSGFSIVRWVGTAANATVGHGLGAVPSMLIIKERGVVDGWAVYHVSVGNQRLLSLNSTNAQSGTSAAYWNNTTPTSTVFSVGTDNKTNGSNAAGMICYAFAPVAGYSAFGSYLANASTDGVFVYLGFRPRFIMIKGSVAGNNWVILDTARDTYNVAQNLLYPNLSSAEATGASLDILSNGFKIRASGGDVNFSSGATYIYAAFAETPAKFSLAR